MSHGLWLILGSSQRSKVENLNFPLSVLERFHQKYQLGYHHIDRNLYHLERRFQKALFLVRDHVAKIIINFWEIESFGKSVVYIFGLAIKPVIHSKIYQFQ